MSNEIKKIAEDVLHGIEYPFKHTAKIIELLNTALKDSPVVKSEVLAMIKQAEAVIADTGTDFASKGLDLTSDLKTLQDIKVFWTYFAGTFVPNMAAIYSEVEADIKA